MHHDEWKASQVASGLKKTVVELSSFRAIPPFGEAQKGVGWPPHQGGQPFCSAPCGVAPEYIESLLGKAPGAMKYTFQNRTSASIIVIVEPWAEEFSVPSGSVLSLEIAFAEFGPLETSIDDKYFTIWLWGDAM